MDKDIVVSVICTTYNHERFIGDAVDSIVHQVAPFKFEFIVGDDCSTDRTPSIVKKYYSRYPSIIRPIFHAENQYSQGKSVLELLIKIAKGKYIAICEGDDFWCDEEKLAKQVAYMEKHPTCTFCFTNARKLDVQTGTMLDCPMLPSTELDRDILGRSHDLGTREMLGISFPPTASFMFRRSCWEQRPIFPKGAFMGDRYLQLVMTDAGYAHYIDEVTCVYRVGNPDSVMGGWSKSKPKLAESIKGYLRLYDEFNRYTGGKYADAIEPLVIAREYSLLTLEGRYEELRDPAYRAHSKSLGKRSRVAYLMRTTFPGILRVLERTRGRA